MPCRHHTVYSSECGHIILHPVGNHDLPTCNKILTHTIEYNKGLCSKCLDALASMELDKFLTRVVAGRKLRPPFVNDWKDEKALQKLFEDRHLRIPPIDHKKTENELRRLLEGRPNVEQREELFKRIVANRRLSVPPMDHEKDEVALRKLFEARFLAPPEIGHKPDKEAVEILQKRILDQPPKPVHEENLFWRERHFEGCRSRVPLSEAHRVLFEQRDGFLWGTYEEVGESQLVFPGLRMGQKLSPELRKREDWLWKRKSELCGEEEMFRRKIVGVLVN